MGQRFVQPAWCGPGTPGTAYLIFPQPLLKRPYVRGFPSNLHSITILLKLHYCFLLLVTVMSESFQSGPFGVATPRARNSAQHKTSSQICKPRAQITHNAPDN